MCTRPPLSLFLSCMDAKTAGLEGENTKGWLHRISELAVYLAAFADAPGWSRETRRKGGFVRGVERGGGGIRRRRERKERKLSASG